MNNWHTIWDNRFQNNLYDWDERMNEYCTTAQHIFCLRDERMNEYCTTAHILLEGWDNTNEEYIIARVQGWVQCSKIGMIENECYWDNE